MLELFDESVAPHYMMGRKPGMFPSFSDAYAEARDNRPNDAEVARRRAARRAVWRSILAPRLSG